MPGTSLRSLMTHARTLPSGRARTPSAVTPAATSATTASSAAATACTTTPTKLPILNLPEVLEPGGLRARSNLLVDDDFALNRGNRALLCHLCGARVCGRSVFSGVLGCRARTGEN